DVHSVARHDVVVNHGRGIVFGVGTLAVRVGQHRGTQHVVRVIVGAAHTLVDHVGQAHVAFKGHLHADLAEHGDDTGVLADRAVPGGGHARVHQNLRHGILGRRVFLTLVGFVHGADKVHGVVIRDVLQGISDALDHVVLANHRHVSLRLGISGARIIA